jgi:NADH-quinone oxidoreductase subunit A
VYLVAVDLLMPVLVMAAVIGGLAATFILGSVFLGPRRRTPIKDEPFESGLPSAGLTPQSVPVRFYLMAILFILFDVELAFLFPWAAVFRSLGLFGLVEMLVFFAIVGAGFVYAWKVGALEWD